MFGRSRPHNGVLLELKPEFAESITLNDFRDSIQYVRFFMTLGYEINVSFIGACWTG